jgi:hypothetical protein
MFLFLFIVFSIFLLPINAHAYIDPGTGSIVVQNGTMPTKIEAATVQEQNMESEMVIGISSAAR